MYAVTGIDRFCHELLTELMSYITDNKPDNT